MSMIDRTTPFTIDEDYQCKGCDGWFSYHFMLEHILCFCNNPNKVKLTFKPTRKKNPYYNHIQGDTHND